jgi:hypothetical protein
MEKEAAWPNPRALFRSLVGGIRAHPWMSGLLGLTGAGIAAAARDVSRSNPSLRRGRDSLLRDSDMIRMALSNAAGFGATGLALGAGLAGISHLIRDVDSEPARDDVFDPGLLGRLESNLGAAPDPGWRRKKADADPAPFGVDQATWDKAPATGGGSPRYSSPWDPSFSIPLAVALGAAGVYGGRHLANRVGYWLRRRGPRKRLREAKEEFEDTVAGLTKGSALDRHLDEAYGFYKEADSTLGLLTAGLGGLSLLSALTVYNHFKKPEAAKIYRQQLKRYLTADKRPSFRVRTPGEIELEREDEFAGVKPLGDANLVDRAFDWADEAASGKAASSDDDYVESAAAANGLELEEALDGLQPSANAKRELPELGGRMVRNPQFRKGYEDAIMKRLDSLGLVSRDAMATVGISKRATIGGAYRWFDDINPFGDGSVKYIANRIEPEVMNTVRRTVDGVAGNANQAYNLGRSAIEGDAGGSPLVAGGGSGFTGKVGQGVVDGIKDNLTANHGIGSKLVVGLGRLASSVSDGVSGLLGKNSSVDDAAREVGERYGEVMTTGKGGISDSTADAVSHIGDRMGGWIGRAIKVVGGIGLPPGSGAGAGTAPSAGKPPSAEEVSSRQVSNDLTDRFGEGGLLP